MTAPSYPVDVPADVVDRAEAVYRDATFRAARAVVDAYARDVEHVPRPDDRPTLVMLRAVLPRVLRAELTRLLEAADEAADEDHVPDALYDVVLDRLRDLGKEP